MPTATMNTDPTMAQMYWPLLEAVITGPVDGLWTITCPGSVTQAQLDEQVVNANAEAAARTNRAALVAKGLAYLALPSPTAAQNTKAIRSLVMLQLEQLTDISGT